MGLQAAVKIDHSEFTHPGNRQRAAEEQNRCSLVPTPTSAHLLRMGERTVQAFWTDNLLPFDVDSITETEESRQQSVEKRGKPDVNGDHLEGHESNQAVGPSGRQSSVDLQVAERMAQWITTMAFTSDAPGKGRIASCNLLAATQCAHSNHLGGDDSNHAAKPSGWQPSVDLQVAEGMVRVIITLKPTVLGQKERRNVHGDDCSASICKGSSKALMQHSSSDRDTGPSGRYCSVGLQAAEHLGMCKDSAHADSTEQPNISNSNVKAEGGSPIVQGQCQSGCMKEEQSSPSWEIRPSGRSCPVDLQVAEHSSGKEERSSPSEEIRPSGRSCSVDLQVAEHSRFHAVWTASTEKLTFNNSNVRAKGTQPFTQGQGCNDCRNDEQSSLNKETGPSGRSCYVDLQVAQHSKFDNRATLPARNYILLSTSTAGKKQTITELTKCLKLKGGGGSTTLDGRMIEQLEEQWLPKLKADIGHEMIKLSKEWKEILRLAHERVNNLENSSLKMQAEEGEISPLGHVKNAARKLATRLNKTEGEDQRATLQVGGAVEKRQLVQGINGTIDPTAVHSLQKTRLTNSSEKNDQDLHEGFIEGKNTEKERKWVEGRTKERQGQNATAGDPNENILNTERATARRIDAETASINVRNASKLIKVVTDVSTDKSADRIKTTSGRGEVKAHDTARASVTPTTKEGLEATSKAQTDNQGCQLDFDHFQHCGSGMQVPVIGMGQQGHLLHAAGTEQRWASMPQQHRDTSRWSRLDQTFQSVQQCWQHRDRSKSREVQRSWGSRKQESSSLLYPLAERKEPERGRRSLLSMPRRREDHHERREKESRSRSRTSRDEERRSRLRSNSSQSEPYSWRRYSSTDGHSREKKDWREGGHKVVKSREHYTTKQPQDRFTLRIGRRDTVQVSHRVQLRYALLMRRRSPKRAENQSKPLLKRRAVACNV